MITTEKRVNVAPSSDSGHFIEDAEKVLNLDEINETYFVEGKSKMVTKNHTTLNISESCLVTTQQVYNPLAKIFERAKD